MAQSPDTIVGASPDVLGARVECTDPATCAVVWETARFPLEVYAGPTPDRIDHSTPVATATGGSAVPVPVDPLGPTYFEVVAEGSAAGPVVTAPDLRLASVHVRDLGGEMAAGGRLVRWGRLFSTDDLALASPDDQDRIAALGLPTTCPRPARRAGAPRDPTRPAALRRDRRLLTSIADSPDAAWTRCGGPPSDWPAALVLSALGVSRETVAGAVLAGQAAAGRTPDRAALDAAFTVVVLRFGSFRSYLTRGLHFGPPERRRLRARDTGPLPDP